MIASVISLALVLTSVPPSAFAQLPLAVSRGRVAAPIMLTMPVGAAPSHGFPLLPTFERTADVLSMPTSPIPAFQTSMGTMPLQPQKKEIQTFLPGLHQLGANLGAASPKDLPQILSRVYEGLSAMAESQPPSENSAKGELGPTPKALDQRPYKKSSQGEVTVLVMLKNPGWEAVVTAIVEDLHAKYGFVRDYGVEVGSFELTSFAGIHGVVPEGSLEELEADPAVHSVTRTLMAVKNVIREPYQRPENENLFRWSMRRLLEKSEWLGSVLGLSAVFGIVVSYPAILRAASSVGAGTISLFSAGHAFLGAWALFNTAMAAVASHRASQPSTPYKNAHSIDKIANALEVCALVYLWNFNFASLAWAVTWPALGLPVMMACTLLAATLLLSGPKAKPSVPGAPMSMAVQLARKIDQARQDHALFDKALLFCGIVGITLSYLGLCHFYWPIASLFALLIIEQSISGEKDHQFRQEKVRIENQVISQAKARSREEAVAALRDFDAKAKRAILIQKVQPTLEGIFTRLQAADAKALASRTAYVNEFVRQILSGELPEHWTTVAIATHILWACRTVFEASANDPAAAALEKELESWASPDSEESHD